MNPFQTVTVFEGGPIKLILNNGCSGGAGRRTGDLLLLDSWPQGPFSFCLRALSSSFRTSLKGLSWRGCPGDSSRADRTCPPPPTPLWTQGNTSDLRLFSTHKVHVAYIVVYTAMFIVCTAEQGRLFIETHSAICWFTTQTTLLIGHAILIYTGCPFCLLLP